MKRNISELIKIFAESHAEKNSVAWTKISEYINSGVNIFASFRTRDGLEQDAAIYYAMHLCNAFIVNKLLDHAETIGHKIDLSYHMFDTYRKEPGEENEKYEWNAIQNTLLYGDPAVVKTLCEYAEKTGQSPEELLKEKILIGTTEVCIQELMVGSLSLQTANTLANDTYSSSEEDALHKKIDKWMAGKDVSLAAELSVENPLKLRWNGRREVFEYLMHNKYIDLRAITSTGRPFYEWLNRVTKNTKFTSQVIKAHSEAMVNEIRVSETKAEKRASLGAVTATGLLPNFMDKHPIPIEVGIELYHVNKLVNDSIIAEDAEIKRQKELEMIRAAAPQPVIHRRSSSFDKMKEQVKQISETVESISEIRIKRYNNSSSKSAEEKACFNTLYQTILNHMSVRKLTATQLIDANPVTINAQIGQFLQATFSIAMSATTVPGAGAIPALTRLILDMSTRGHAKKQSSAVFEASLVASVETMILDLSEKITAEIMKLYHNQLDTVNFGVVASEVAKLIIKRVDRDLHHAEIENEDQLSNFMLRESLIALDTHGKKDKADPFALHTLQTKVREMGSTGTGFSSGSSSISSHSSDEHSDKHSAIKDANDYEYKGNKKGSNPGNCCNIS